MMKPNQRRRVIKLLVVGAGVCAAPRTALALARQAGPRLHHWRGEALGADISMQFYHNDPKEAARIIGGAVDLIEQMEELFSLYRPDSYLSQLNRTGQVAMPPADFVALLRDARKVSDMTGGAFDVTVQPLWRFYQSHFARQDAGQGPEFKAEAAAKRALVGYGRLLISDQRVSFERPGMAATLNGIAQGYATDRVAEYFRSEGMTSVLVDMGEYRALGPQADQTPWRIGLADPVRFGKLSEILEIGQGAVATSSGTRDIFEASGRYHHLLDPRKGASADHYLSVTVTAAEATLADALSTAFCSMSEAAIADCLRTLPGATARLIRKDGSRVTL